MTEQEAFEALRDILSDIADYVQTELKRLHKKLGEKTAYRDTYPDGQWGREVAELVAIDTLDDLRYRFDLKRFEFRPPIDQGRVYAEAYSKTIKALESREEGSDD